jgi:hypothetical protein
MKKIGILILVVIGTFAFTSCSEDKCECTVNGQTQTITEDDVNNGSTLNEACDDADAVNKAQGSGSCKMV